MLHCYWWARVLFFEVLLLFDYGHSPSVTLFHWFGLRFINDSQIMSVDALAAALGSLSLLLIYGHSIRMDKQALSAVRSFVRWMSERPLIRSNRQRIIIFSAAHHQLAIRGRARKNPPKTICTCVRIEAAGSASTTCRTLDACAWWEVSL